MGKNKKISPTPGIKNFGNLITEIDVTWRDKQKSIFANFGLKVLFYIFREW